MKRLRSLCDGQSLTRSRESDVNTAISTIDALHFLARYGRPVDVLECYNYRSVGIWNVDTLFESATIPRLLAEQTHKTQVSRQSA